MTARIPASLQQLALAGWCLVSLGLAGCFSVNEPPSPLELVDSGPPRDVEHPWADHVFPWAESDLWAFLQRPIAATADGTVFVLDHRDIFAVRDGVAEIYLSWEELNGAAGDSPIVAGLAVGPDQLLYVLIQGPTQGVYVSRGPAELTLLTAATDWDLPPALLRAVGVDSNGEVLVALRRAGVAHVWPGEARLLYEEAELFVDSSCSDVSFSVGSGRFYYIGGCVTNGMVIGRVDGGGIVATLTADAIEEQLDTPFLRVTSVAAHPDGGAVINVARDFVRVDVDGGFARLRSRPMLGVLGHDKGLAIDGSGAMYLASRERIYRLEPLPD